MNETDIDEIKKILIQQVKREFENPKISPFTTGWEKGVNLLFDVIECTDFREELVSNFKKVLISEKGKHDVLLSFSSHLEKYLKFIGYHTGKIPEQQAFTLMLSMKKLNLNRELSSQLPVKKHSDFAHELEPYPFFKWENLASFESKREFLAHLCRAYCTRNDATHEYPDWADDDVLILQNRNSILVTFVYATLKYYDPLQTVVKKINAERKTNIQFYQEDIKSYLKKVIADFEKWPKRFVAIRGTERIELYAREELEDEDRQAREGTVESLRDSMSEKQMMILGEAGMGKTTTLEYLTHSDAQKCLANLSKNLSAENISENIPVHFKLKHFTSERTLAEEIFHILHLKSELTESLLKNGKITLFLDGLNEIIVKEKRQDAINQIQKLLNSYPETQLLISSRNSQRFDIQNAQRMPVFQLNKMGEKQIFEFIKKNASLSSQKTIQDKLEEDSVFLDWLCIPMWLKMIIEVVEKQGEIPERRPKLMEAFFEQMYERERNNDNSFETRPFKILIAHLAFSFYEESSNSMKEDQVFYILGQKIKDVLEQENFLKKASDFHILINEGNNYSFSHEEFFYYFANKGELIATGKEMSGEEGDIEFDF